MGDIELTPTVDPDVFLEEARDGYKRYRSASTGRRWEVHGICDRRGDCIMGATMATPDGPVACNNASDLAYIRQRFGTDFVNAQIDVPVTPEFSGCCPFTYTELDPVPPAGP